MENTILEVLNHNSIPVILKKAVPGLSFTHYQFEFIDIPTAEVVRNMKHLKTILTIMLKTSVDVDFISGQRNSQLEINVRNDKRTIVKLSDILENKFSENSKLPVCIGKNEIFENVTLDIVNAPNILIAGSTGSGKTELLKTLITTMILDLQRDNKEIYICSKKPDIKMFQEALFVEDVYTKWSDINNLCYAAIVHMKKRYEQFEKDGIEDIEEYNNKYPDRKMNYIVLILDEFESLTADNKNILTYVTKLVTTARAAGIHIILSTQNPSAKTLTTEIKNGCPYKIALKCSTPQTSRMILNSVEATKLIGNGDAILSVNNENVRFQAAYITDEEKKLLIETFSKE